MSKLCHELTPGRVCTFFLGTQELCHSFQELVCTFCCSHCNIFLSCQVTAVKPQPGGSGVLALVSACGSALSIHRKQLCCTALCSYFWFSLKTGICNLCRSSLELLLVSSFPRVSQQCCRGSIFNHASAVALIPRATFLVSSLTSLSSAVLHALHTFHV